MVPGDRRAHLAHRGETSGKVLAALEFEKDDRPLGRDENVAAGGVKRVDLHVGRTGRVSDIGRIVEQSAGAADSARSRASLARCIRSGSTLVCGKFARSGPSIASPFLYRHVLSHIPGATLRHLTPRPL